jgi:rhodanese-related sulfurtransferase
VLADDPLRPLWAAALLQRLGFLRVRVLEDGLATWTQAGRALQAEDGVPAAFGLAAARRQVAGITAATLAERLGAQQPPLLLDVRGSGEFAVGHLPGARWLARGRLELDVDGLAPDRGAAVVTVCDTGVRSTLAAATLRSLGYRDVAYLEGGLPTWQRAGLPIVEGLQGANVTVAEAQADFGHTVWTGALGRSLADMGQYLSWEQDLAQQQA